MERGDKYFNNLVGQLASNPPLWEAFQQNGVMETTELQLDFTYYSPTAEDAAALKSLLEEYGYTVAVSRSGSLLRRKWLLEGKTVKTTLTLEKLNQWTEWMVLAGEEHHSDFDGYGAGMP